jgi:hypothetical protein
MIEDQTIYMFHEGATFYRVAYTLDATGANLPDGSWTPFPEPMRVSRGEGPRAGVNVEEVQAEIRKHGICVNEGVVTVQAVPAPPGFRFPG